jgi:tetratricopeptide (TPR) repeat protein
MKQLFDTTLHEPLRRAGYATALSQLAARRGAFRERDRWLDVSAGLRSGGAGQNPALALALPQAGDRVLAFGDTAGAVRIIDAALAKSPIDRMAELDRPYAALVQAYAQAGRPDRARQYLAGATKNGTELDPTRGYVVSIARAELLMAEHKWTEAIDVLRKTFPGRCGQCLFRARALAFDGAQQRDSAIFWNERWLAAIGIRGTSWVTTQRRLGELYAEKGDVSKALAHYQAFVDSWKDADPELQPQVAEVRQRIARLQQQERVKR